MNENMKSMLAELEDYCIDRHVYDFREGARVGLRPNKTGDSLYIMNIRTDTTDRGKGSASKALATLCEMADRFGVVMFLEVEEEVEESDGMDADQLLDWYWRNGFRGDAPKMVREPSER